MYRKVIEHPEWIPDEMEKTLDINAGKEKGRIYKIYQKEEKPFDPSSFNNEASCIALLSHKNGWYRKTAQRKLIENGISADGKNKLLKLIKGNNELASLHAMWVLHELSLLDVSDLKNNLQHSNPGIRENAIIISENYLDNKEIQERLLDMLNDQDQRVKMQAALTLSLLPSETVMQIKEKIIQQMIQQDASIDEWNIAAFTLASKYFPLEGFEALIKSNQSNKLIPSLALQLRDSSSAIEKCLATIKDNKIKSNLILDILNQFNQGNKQFQSKNIQSSFASLESDNFEVLAALTKLSNRFGLPPSPKFLSASKAALENLVNPSFKEQEKLEWLKIIQLLPYQQKSTVLFSCLKNNVPLKIQEEALRQLSTYSEKEIGTKIISMWSEMSPSTRRYASDLLLYINLYHDALLNALEKGTIQIGEMNFDLERRRMLISWTDDQSIRTRARKLFSDEEIISRKDAIAKMEPALHLQGNVAEGEKIFQGICSNCHRYGNIGKEVGPVLTEIKRKSKESIMHDILDPNAAVNTQYISHRIETKDGMIHIGVIDFEDDETVIMKKMGGEKITFTKKEIAKMNSMGKSLMMEGLEGSMTHQQMADLLAFLQKK